MFRIIRWKLLTTIALILLGIYAIYPSVQLYQMPREERYGPEPETAELRDNALKLGLDLLGGMHLVLELDKSELSEDEASDAQDRAIEILRNRIDQFGVAEPTIQPQGDDRIIIELPGLLDKQRAIDIVGQTAQLEFLLVRDPEESARVLERIDRALARGGVPDTVAAGDAGADADTTAMAATDTTGADTLATDPFETDDFADVTGERPLLDLLFSYPDFSQFGGALVTPERGAEMEELLRSQAFQAAVPRGSQVSISASPEPLASGQEARVLYVLQDRAELTGAAISNAVMQIGLDPLRPTEAGVSMTMNARGANQFRRITGRNVGRQLAIVLDDRVASAPFIRDRIPSGRAQITGNFTVEDARDLAIVLRAGALPAPVRIIEERTVGPSLGQDSIRTGVSAGLIGAAAVALFMLVYYQLSGIIAVCALILNVFLLLAGLAALRGTLTLPGIAGIVLTIGMAVDANVLIFERIREELRAGRKVRSAVESGYSRAFQTILDANVTTLISSAVLFQFGTGPIKGFAITLGIGILANLFTAVVFTRMVFDAVLAGRSLKRLSI